MYEPSEPVTTFDTVPTHLNVILAPMRGFPEDATPVRLGVFTSMLVGGLGVGGLGVGGLGVGGVGVVVGGLGIGVVVN